MATRDEGDEHDESMGEREARAWAASLTWAATLTLRCSLGMGCLSDMGCLSADGREGTGRRGGDREALFKVTDAQTRVCICGP